MTAIGIAPFIFGSSIIAGKYYSKNVLQIKIAGQTAGIFLVVATWSLAKIL